MQKGDVVRSQIRLLVLASAVTFSASVHAEGFMDALNMVSAIAGAGAQPQVGAAQVQNAQLEAAANDIMTTLGVSTKTQNAKRAVVMQKLALLQGGQYMGAIPGNAGAIAGGNGKMGQAMAVMGAMQGNNGAGNPMAGLMGLAGGNANAAAANGKLGQAMAVMGAVQGASNAAAENGGAAPSMQSMALSAFAKSQGNSSLGKIAGFLAENPEMVDQLLALSNDASPENFSMSLGKFARAQQAKGKKNSTAWQVTALMAENPELTRQVLGVVGQSSSMFGSLGNMFKSSPSDEKKSESASGESGGGFFGGLKGMFKGGGESQSAAADAPSAAAEPAANPFSF